MLQSIKRLLSGQAATITCFILACIGRVAYVITSIAPFTDKSYQLQAARNFREGNGITILESSWQDLSAYAYTPLIKWPPLYSILTAPFSGLNGPYYLGALIVDILTCIAFVWIGRKLFGLLGRPRWQLNLFTLLIGFFYYHFALCWSTDLLAVVFLMAGTYQAVVMVQKGNASRFNLAFIILLLWLSGFTRFLSIPLAFVPVLYLALEGYQSKSKRLIKAGAFIGVGLAALFGLQYLLTRNIAGAAVYLYPFEKGFYPENLLQTPPFLLASAGNFEPLALRTAGFLGLPFDTIQKFFVYVHLVLLVGFLIFSIRLTAQNRLRHPYQRLALLYSVACVCILGFLSVIYAKGHNGWTYVSEMRYYAVAIIFLQLSFFSLSFRKLKGAFRIMALIVILTMSLSVLHSAVYVGRSIAGDAIHPGRKRDFIELEKGLSILENHSKAHPGNIVCISNEPVFTNLAALKLYIPGIHNVRQLQNPPQTRSAVYVFAALKKNFGSRLTELLTLDEADLIAETTDWTYYLTLIKPAQDQK